MISTPHSAPPEVLDRPIEVGPDDWQGRAFYFLMNALVVPRPIGWISTISKEGVRNLDRKSTRLNSSHIPLSRMPSSACKQHITAGSKNDGPPGTNVFAACMDCV